MLLSLDKDFNVLRWLVVILDGNFYQLILLKEEVAVFQNSILKLL